MSADAADSEAVQKWFDAIDRLCGPVPATDPRESGLAEDAAEDLYRELIAELGAAPQAEHAAAVAALVRWANGVETPEAYAKVFRRAAFQLRSRWKIA